MPEPENDCMIIDARNGYVRDNYSWALSRLLRDFEHWKPLEVTATQIAKLKEAPPERQRLGLTVSIFRSASVAAGGRGDWIYYLGFLVAAIQLAIAAIPWALFGEWLTFLVTASGTILAFLSGSLPQWRREKIGVRVLDGPGSIDWLITSGNGSPNVIMILGVKGGLDFAALASPYRDFTWRQTTRTLALVYAILWIILLISIAGYNEHTWFLLGVGLIGLFHNVLAASVKRRPEPCGIKLEYVNTITEPKVMTTLWNLEGQYPGAGAAILPVFFPGQLFPREAALWDYASRRSRAWRRERGSNNSVSDFEWKMPPVLGRFSGRETSDIPQDGPYTG